MITNNLRNWSRFACEMQRIKKIFPEHAEEIKNCVLNVAEKTIIAAELEPETTVKKLTEEAENLRLCEICGFPLDKTQNRFCSKICDSISKRKRYVKGRYVSLNLKGKRVYLHRVIWEKNSGRRLQKGEVVHHINCNPLDNRPQNLQAMTVSEHNALHERLRRQEKRDANRNFSEIGW